jgi:cation diffusion facilitator CzcD-associated flavoprotein CzcO
MTGVAQFDAIVIGAGVSGLYQLHKLRELGFSVRAYEAGGGVGGTWYWNRYPGCRFDSESWTYGYAFDPDLAQEWDWTEHFSPQPETERYLNFVADRLDLRRDIVLSTRISAAHWQDDRACWRVTTDGGDQAECRFLVTALGALSTPVMPAIAGIDRFAGETYHTARWPQDPVDFRGKRVAVIGTGATGVQLIQEVAKTADHLTVFQRTANWCVPLHNSRITTEEQAAIKADLPGIIERCKTTFGQFIHDSDRRNAVDLSPEEREAVWQELYDAPGFALWMANFRDVLIDAEANRLLSDWVAAKIRARVHDPAVADLLIPTDHGFGMRRVPMETGYYEVYNQPNVGLVDLRATPIETITETGIRTTAEDFGFDMILFATGFDAVTGAFDKIDFRGVGGVPLREVWAEGPWLYLGLAIPGFPNLFTLVGPHNAATFCNMPRCIEQNVDWVADLLVMMRRRGDRTVEAQPDAADAWKEHVLLSGSRMLFTQANSWFMGVNMNLAHRQERVFMLYAAGMPRFRDRCDAVAADGYPGFTFA